MTMTKLLRNVIKTSLLYPSMLSVDAKSLHYPVLSEWSMTMLHQYVDSIGVVLAYLNANLIALFFHCCPNLQLCMLSFWSTSSHCFSCYSWCLMVSTIPSYCKGKMSHTAPFSMLLQLIEAYVNLPPLMTIACDFQHEFEFLFGWHPLWSIVDEKYIGYWVPNAFFSPVISIQRGQLDLHIWLSPLCSFILHLPICVTITCSCIE